MEKYLGKIRIDGKMTISDPCYEPGIWSALEVKVAPGWYKCFADVKDMGAWGTRICSLSAIREDYADDVESLDWTSPCSVGVDSGQMGIYDTDYFKENQPDDEWENPDSWYRRVCALTYDEEGKRFEADIIDGLGCVSSSGYGDGNYDVITYVTNDYIVGAKVVFIEDYEEE